jgi:acetyltransferase-like isoleucine patch superfamily enzyme
MRAAIEIVCWLFPPTRLKNNFLRRFGHHISATARIGPTIVLGVRRFEIGENVLIAPFNVFKNLSLVRLDDNVIIGSWNWITAAAEFQQIDPQAGTLHMGYGAAMTSRHYLDCSGTIIMKRHARIGGGRAYLQTHEPDFEHFRQTVGRIVLGDHALVSTCAVVLKGAHLPDRSLLAANSTMLALSKEHQQSGVYAGSPAQWRRDIDGEYFRSGDHMMTEFVVDGPMGPLEDPTATEWPED